MEDELFIIFIFYIFLFCLFSENKIIEGYSVCPDKYYKNNIYQNSNWHEAENKFGPDNITLFSTIDKENNTNYMCDDIEDYKIEPPTVIYHKEFSCSGNGCSKFPKAVTFQDSPETTNFLDQYNKLTKAMKDSITLRDNKSNKIFADPMDLEESQEKGNRALSEYYTGKTKDEIKILMNEIYNSDIF